MPIVSGSPRVRVLAEVQPGEAVPADVSEEINETDETDEIEDAVEWDFRLPGF